MAEDKPSQEGRDEPEYHNPPINSQLLHPLLIIHWMGYKRLSPNVNLRPQVVLDTKVWLPTIERDWSSHLPSRDIMLNTRKVQDKSSGVTGESWQTLGVYRLKLEGTIYLHFSHYVNLHVLSVAPGGPWPRRSSPLILIPCIKTLTLQLNCWVSMH